MEKQRKINDKESTLLATLEAEFGSISELRGLALDSSPKLIAYLLESSAEFGAFFSKIGEVVVFEREKFLEFLRLRVLDKSYTAFSNKIGLRLERQELQGTDRVVLDFPYKDCVLKGGQSKDEQKGKTTKKYEEIFFHNVIAGSEIDVLCTPKALQNFELVGHSSCTAISAESAKIAHSLTSSKLNRTSLDNPQTSGTILECQTSTTSHTSELPALSQSMSNTPHSQSLHNPDFSSQSLECQDSTAIESTDKTAPKSPQSEKSAAKASLRAGGSLRGNPQDERESTNTPAFKATNEREREREREQLELKNSLTSKPNLLIKGNNLLALHTLKERKDIYGQVKLIYIDPPYNTGSDSFNYNDKFNHSTWLTFMQNRLKVARDFLRDDGVIFIQCDDNEQAYLKVLCDEIFCPQKKRENFVSTLHIELSTTQGMKVGAAQKGKIVKNGEYILIYAKNINQTYFTNILYESKEWDDHYSVYIDPATNERTTLLNFLIQNYPLNDNQKFTKAMIEKLYSTDENFRIFIHKNAKDIYRDAMIDIKFNFTKDEEKVLNQGSILKYQDYFIFKTSTGIIRQLLPLEKSIGYTDDFDAKFGLRKIRGDWWSGFYKDMMNINKEADLVWKAGKKPERLIKDILKLTTHKGDLVMDFFAGSGTTLAVAHKMQRRWIGIEQMDYVESITKERLKKVVSGEQGGVSKALNWQGGGGFIYTELMPLNAVYREKILKSSDEKELEKLYNDLESKAFTNYRVDIQEMLKDKNAQKDKEANIYKEFHDLSLEEKKGILYAILDPNMDYVPYSEIEDKSYGVSDELIELNRIFYGEGDFSQPFNEGENTESSLQDEAKAIHISESKQIDCHALPSKARNDGAGDRDNTETRNDKISGRDNNNAEAKSSNDKKAKSSIKNLESKGGKDE